MSARTDEWLTPANIIAALGPFDLDPASPVNRPRDTAMRHYSVLDNGLQRDWHGRIWLNPPYHRSVISKWMARMAMHNWGTALVNASTDCQWFFTYVWPMASAVLFLKGRIEFESTVDRGAKRDHNRNASVLIAYGIDDADRLAAADIDGAFQPLACVGQQVAVLRALSSLTWPQLLLQIVQREGGRISLAAAYVLVGRHPKARTNPNYEAKIRQTLQGPAFQRVDRGVYQLCRS